MKYGFMMIIFYSERMIMNSFFQGDAIMTDLMIYIVMGVIIPGMLITGIALRHWYLHFRHDHHGHHPA
jgi:hypothetical protein